MGRNNSALRPLFLKFLLVTLLVIGVSAGATRSIAGDLPLAAGSPLAGFAFDDRPLLLPVQRNFQMAMLTASSELGRSCGKMEAYGWRMSQSEQQRVNQIFNNTVDRLRGLGYIVEAQTPTSVSRDITMFTADRPDRHFIVMWSAGEIGLVMVLCESSASLSGRTAIGKSPSVQTFPQAQDVLKSTLETPVQDRARRGTSVKFSPIGDWVGGYTCTQGYTGATLQISHLKGEDFDGIFHFYPTPKNPYVPEGRYTVYGQYDQESHRILINPGKWLERPKNYYNTIIVGSFDPVARNFSAYFQGIVGCTSFEAKYAPEDYVGKATHKTAKKKKHKKVVKTSVTPAAASMVTPAPVTPAPVDNGASIILPAVSPTPASVPQAVTPVPVPAAQPATAAPEPLVQPTPVPVAPSPAPVAPSPAPIAPAPTPSVAPAPPVTAPTPAPTAPSPPLTPLQPAPKPSGMLEPTHQATPIVVAESGQWITPTVQQAPRAVYISPNVPQVSPAPSAPTAQIASPASVITPNVPQVPQAPTAPQAVVYEPSVPEVSQAPTVPQAQQAPPADYFNPTVQQVPPAQMVPNTGGPHP